MNAEDLRFYIASLGETRTIMNDIITILRTQEQTISDIVNHPSYMYVPPPPRTFSTPNYFGRTVPSYLRRSFSPTRTRPRRSYAQSPLTRPNRSPPRRSPPVSSPPLRRNSVTSTSIGPRPEISPPPPPPPAPPAPNSSVLDIMNDPPVDIPGSSNSNTPRSSANRLFGTSISNSNTPSPNRNNVAQANPVAARIADLLGVALLNELNTAGLSPVTVRPTDRQIRDSTELVQYSSMFDPSTEQEPQYSRCPISHEEFSVNSRVYRIRHCGHYFEPQSLLTWFRTSVRCPVCRYDIRSHLPDNHSHSHSVEEEDIMDEQLDPIQEDIEEEIEENEEEIIEENNSSGSSINEFMNHIRDDQLRNPLARNRRRVYRYQFDVTPFVTRALRGDAADAASSADADTEPAAGPTEPTYNYDPSGNNSSLNTSTRYRSHRYST